MCYSKVCCPFDYVCSTCVMEKLVAYLIGLNYYLCVIGKLVAYLIVFSTCGLWKCQLLN